MLKILGGQGLPGYAYGGALLGCQCHLFVTMRLADTHCLNRDVRKYVFIFVVIQHHPASNAVV